MGSEAVDHPAHYGGGDNLYEAIKVMEAWGEAWSAEGISASAVINLTQVLKYLRRHTHKGRPVEDLAKAAWYLARAITQAAGGDLPAVPDVLAGMWVVCDRCRLKCDAGDGREFVREHIDHVFNGLRVVLMQNPCPNRARDYTEVADH